MENIHITMNLKENSLIVQVNKHFLGDHRTESHDPVRFSVSRLTLILIYSIIDEMFYNSVCVRALLNYTHNEMFFFFVCIIRVGNILTNKIVWVFQLAFRIAERSLAIEQTVCSPDQTLPSRSKANREAIILPFTIQFPIWSLYLQAVYNLGTATCVM